MKSYDFDVNDISEINFQRISEENKEVPFVINDTLFVPHYLLNKNSNVMLAGQPANSSWGYGMLKVVDQGIKGFIIKIICHSSIGYKKIPCHSVLPLSYDGYLLEDIIDQLQVIKDYKKKKRVHVKIISLN